MARVIRFPLRMNDGTDSRTLEDLKAHFDLDSVLGYFADGKLQTWLSDRYYDDLAKAVSELTEDMPDLGQRICDIFEVDYKQNGASVDIDEIKRRNDKLALLRNVTDDKEVLDNIDRVVLNQEELDQILKTGSGKIYLYGDSFIIPLSNNDENNTMSGKYKNILYIGLNNPCIVIEDESCLDEYENNDILFKGTHFDENLDLYKLSAERLYLNGNYTEAFPLIKKASDAGNPRAMILLSDYYEHGYGTVAIDRPTAIEYINSAYESDYKLAKLYRLVRTDFGEDLEIGEDEVAKWIEAIKPLIDKQDFLTMYVKGLIAGACQDFDSASATLKNISSLGHCPSWWYLGYSSEQSEDYENALRYYKRCAERKYADGQVYLGLMHMLGKGVNVDYSLALEYLKEAADQGHADGLHNLAVMYREGMGVNIDYSKSFDYALGAAKQEVPLYQYEVGIIYAQGLYGISENSYEASKWLEKAAEGGIGEAAMAMAGLYLECKLGEFDDKTLIKWLKMALKNGIDDTEMQQAAKDMLVQLGVDVSEYTDSLKESKGTITQNKGTSSNGIEEIRYEDDVKMITSVVDRYLPILTKGSAQWYPSYQLCTIEKTVERAKNKLGRRATGTIIGLIDWSFFNNGNDGVLFTTKGLAFDFGFEKVFIDYQSISSMDISGDKLMFNGSFSGYQGNPFFCPPSLSNLYLNLFNLKKMIEEIIAYLAFNVYSG